MTKYYLNNFFKTSVVASIFAGLGFSYPYYKYVTQSKFEIASSKLSFNGYVKNNKTVSATEHQEALLKQLQIAGYLKPEYIWNAIKGLKIENPEQNFKAIYSAIKQSNGDQNSPSKFKSNILIKTFAEGSNLSNDDVKDFILYLSQNAFGRNTGQERNELSSKDWMHDYAKEYFENAKILGLIDRGTPERNDYDEVWIAGASRVGVLARIIDYYNTESKYGIQVKRPIKILAGERELWSNIDGINPKTLEQLIKSYKEKIDIDDLNILVTTGPDQDAINEGKQYLINLASWANIRLNQSSPLISYETNSDIPNGRFPGRIYANYSKEEKAKLTETLMSQHLLYSYFPKDFNNINIIDTLSDENNNRPTTSTTATDAAESFIANVVKKNPDQKEFHILFQTNNPYIERQTIATQTAVNKSLNSHKLNDITIKVDGIGFKCKQDVPTVHSEFAALITEQWKLSTQNIETKRDIKNLLYQTRDYYESENDFPDLEYIDYFTANYLLGELYQLFDNVIP